MKILDWYILKRFLVTFCFTILTLTIIAVVIDTSEKTDDFVKSGLSFWQILTRYYSGFIPVIIGMIFPLIVFISVIFFTSKLAARSEIVAILANGVNFNRLLRPYMIGGIGIALLLWISNRYVIPKASGIYADFKSRYIDNNSGYPISSKSMFYLRVDSNTFVGMRNFNDTAFQAAGSFFLQRINGNKVSYNLRSSSIKWDAARKRWKLEHVVERKINGMEEKVRRIDSMYINLNIQPKDLRRNEYTKDKLTTPELDEFIRQEELRGAEGLNTLKVERYRRDATPFSVIILTFMGVCISTRKTRGGSGLHLALGIIAAASFVLIDRFSTVFSTKSDFHPLLAAWTPNLLFSLVAFYIYRKAPK